MPLLRRTYPFLEIVGEAGSGKSTLIEFLWQLLGRADYEGFDPNKATPAALSRILSQVSNLPISLIESDREDSTKTRQFDWDQLKTAYNGRASRARGIKNGGNDTYEPPFRGSILISQNNTVAASDAILQRIVHLHFSCARHSREGKAAADALFSLPTEAVSAFILFATVAEQDILTTLRTRQPDYERKLLVSEGIHNIRIAKNHGQIMALVEALDRVMDLGTERTAETLDAIADLARQRERDIAADHPMVESFWDVVDCVVRAGLKGVTPHTLRHTAVTWLVQAGIPLWEVSQWVGLSIRMIETTYGHHAPDRFMRIMTAKRG